MTTKMVMVPAELLEELEVARNGLNVFADGVGVELDLRDFTGVMWKLANTEWEEVTIQTLDIDWSGIDPVFTCAAMDADGDVYVYEEAPTPDCVQWDFGMNTRWKKHSADNSSDVLWHRSLTTRPEGE